MKKISCTTRGDGEHCVAAKETSLRTTFHTFSFNFRAYNLRAYATVKIHLSVMTCFLNIDFQKLQELGYLRLASVAHGKEACDS